MNRPLPYLPQLDGLRAIAISCVLLAHFYPRLFLTYIPAGFYGVRLFFVLSGYLITRILLGCRDLIDSGVPAGQLLGRFYSRRALRLFPALWFALAVGALYLPEVRESWPWHVAYLSNAYFIQHGDFQGSISHLWTLAVEEQFYLVWPLLLLGLARWKIKPLIVVLIVAAPLTRFVLAALGASSVAIQVPPISSADALGLGVLLAIVLRDSPALCERIRYWSLPLGLAGMIAARLLPPASPLNWAFAGLAVAIFSTGLVSGCIAGFGGPFGRLLESRPAIGLGRISYGVYVYHLFVMGAYARFAPRWLPQHPGWDAPMAALPPFTPAMGFYFLILSTLSIAVAALSWRYVEQPALRLKRYLPYGSSRLSVERRNRGRARSHRRQKGQEEPSRVKRT